MQDVMVDIETLGNGSNSVIISIGAVEFNRHRATTGQEFYVNIDAQSCIDAGLQMDASTVMWWMQQTQEAREVFKAKSLPLIEALHQFALWYPNGAALWGNGATFDNVILSNAYRKTNTKQPWSYAKDRCYRTLKNLAPDVKQENVGVAHNALDDAKYQALHAIKLLNALKF